jgi:pyruvate/2-oxoglutarate dehydrogenase complex dihydrolipoamide dehydrogenase (E3) component
MAEYDNDMLVIGSGPAGHRAAIQAAKLDKRVAVIEKKSVVGGVCINTGTIPSKTLRGGRSATRPRRSTASTASGSEKRVREWVNWSIGESRV